MANQKLALIFTFVLCLFETGMVWAQQSTQDLMGSWHIDGIFCSHQDNITKQVKVTETRIFPIEALEFEPDVTIQISSDGRNTYLRKSVGNRSCRANEIQEKTFLDVVFAVRFIPESINGKPAFKMTSSKVISPMVNAEAFQQCGSMLNGLILRALAGFKYPAYFTQEMNRTYHVSLVDGRLVLRFQDSDICDTPSAQTLMTFSRSQH